MANFDPAPHSVADIGVTGMAVMGSNLARNLARNGFKVAIHNRSVEKTERVIANHGSDGEFRRLAPKAARRDHHGPGW